MLEWKPVLLPVFLAAGLVITGLSTPASADQGRGGWGRNDQPRGDIKPRRFEQDAARRAMLDGQVMPFSIIKRRVEREMDGANYLGSEFDNRRGEYRLKYMREGRVVWVDVDGRSGDIVRRSEVHTSEFKSIMRISFAVFCLKKKTRESIIYITYATN